METAIRILHQGGCSPGRRCWSAAPLAGRVRGPPARPQPRGVHVIGTAGAGNQDYLRSLGATATTYGGGLVERVRALAPRGGDAALDLAESGIIAESIELTGDPTKVLSIADFNAPALGAQVSGTTTEPAAAFTEAARLFTAGALHIPVQQTFTFDTAAHANDVSAAGHVVGRPDHHRHLVRAAQWVISRAVSS